MKSLLSCSLLALGIGLAHSAVSWSSARQSQTPTPAAPAIVRLLNPAFDGSRRVWINPMRPPTNDLWHPEGGTQHSDSYALNVVEKEGQQVPGPSTIERMIASGFNGAQIWTIDDPSGKVAAWLHAADAHPCFVIAPQIEIFDGGEDKAVRILTRYAELAREHPRSAATVRLPGETFDRLLVYIYGPLDLPFWKAVRQRVEGTGTPLYLIATTHHAGEREKMAPLFPVFEANFLWGVDEARWNRTVALMNEYKRPFAGGLGTGYNRETSIWAGYSDAEGTADHRRQWERALASGLQWQNVVTWDDYAERTAVAPSSSYNWTRADINAFYAAKMRRTPYPDRLKTPQLYVTSGQFARLGQTPKAEALVLNTGPQPVRVTLTFVDGAGKIWGRSRTALVPPGRSGAATTALLDATPQAEPFLSLQAYPAKRFLRAQAVMTDARGRELQQVTSAPIVVYNEREVPAPFPTLRLMYYSIPARKALPGKVQVTLKGNPNAPGATATVVPPARTAVRYADVLQNLRLARNFFARADRTVAAPFEPYWGEGWEHTQSEAHGFYVGRVVDSQERVGYSDPVWVPAPRNLLVNSSFDDGDGSAPAGWQRDGAPARSVEPPGGAHDGKTALFLGDDAAATPTQAARPSRVTQQVRGLANGKYALKAWYKNSNADDAAGSLRALGEGAVLREAPLPPSGKDDGTWRLVTLHDIEVNNATDGANGSLTVEIAATLPKGLLIDDVRLYRQPTGH